MRVTVTFLVRATEYASCDCAVVRDWANGPWTGERGNDPLRMNGSMYARRGTDASVPPLQQSLTKLPLKYRYKNDDEISMRTIRFCLAVFMVGLVVSGLTAFPLVHEVGWLAIVVHSVAPGSGLLAWVLRVQTGLNATAASYPFLAYGTDWLAFAHLVLAVAFVGPWQEPVRNKWVIQFGLIACAGVIPLALIAGAARGIPWWWRVGDCSFGVFGAVPLLIALREVERMERAI